ncbi:MAG: phosphoribosyltransferase [Pseudomonadota bacterium]|jgi:ATP phosphoribosyltransferase
MTNLVLAVPSKGRLQENANAFFARAGLDVVRGRGLRDYRGTLAGLEGVEIAFLSASEIVSQLAAGTAHMGITGEDLVRETLPDADAKVELLTPLGFGHANVVVAVPQAWIDVRNMADLEDVAAAYRSRRGERMRVATKYINLTRSYFAEQGVTDYRIVESLGATEGAPAAGQAELIVDITTTGATLAANALKVLDDGIMLRSEANLVASLTADWNERTRNIARVILGRIAAEEEARTTREVRAIIAGDRTKLVAQAEKLFAARAPLGIAKDGPLTLVAAKKKVADLADWLVSQGADRVTVAQMDYIFSSKNELFEKLSARIG